MTIFVLKLIALISMTIDHAGAVVFWDLRWMRYVGRLAFPIYAFMLVEGYCHTKSVRKYLTRLGIFAIISEVPFDIAANCSYFDLSYQNVFFTLFLGLVAVRLVDRFVYHTFLQCASVAAIACLAQFMHTDYRYIGICLVVIFYVYRDRLFFRFEGAVNTLVPFSSSIEFFALFSMLPISLYNGKLGRHKYKYFFYIYYPAHLLLLSYFRKLKWGIWTY